MCIRDSNNILVVVSALGGITNLLQKCLTHKGKSTDNVLKEIEERHLEIINNLSSTNVQGYLRDY